MKQDSALAERYADVAGRIDRKAFERAVRPLFAIWLGNLVLLAGLAVGAVAIVVAKEAANLAVAGLALVVSAGAFSVSAHDLAHLVTGRAVCIRFTHYFFGGPFPPRPGIKTDYATYLRALPARRAAMHASGALASKVAPFVSLAFYPASNAPAWAAWAVLAFAIFQIVTDVLFSTKSSDWKKVIRERRLARVAEGGAQT